MAVSSTSSGTRAPSNLRDNLLLVSQIVLLAIVVGFALYPLLDQQRLPASPEEWASLVIPIGAVLVAATVVFVVGIRGRQQRVQLLRAYEDLRVAVASGLVGDEALRVSVARGKVGDRRLRESVASGKVGDENLRIAVASGLEGDENLRVAVASGLVGDENLRIAVASGLEGDENLRLAVESGLVGDQKLRESVASGLVGDENLRIAVASGLEGDENLRVSVESGLIGAEKLRISVAEGIVGAEALRVSVADGIDGAEALRVSIAQGLDAASAALAVVDTVDAGITFYDPDGAILLTNDTARELRVSNELQAGPGATAPLIFEDDGVTPIPQIDYILAKAARGQLVTRRAYWVGSGDRQRALMATSQFVKRASGELIGTVIATHDVTPLAQAIRARDEFLETVSHELRTPLTSIIGYLEIIEDTIDIATSGIEHEFRIVERNSQRLLKLIVDLLLTAEGEASVERRPFDIAEIAGNSLNAIRSEAAVAGIRIMKPEFDHVLAAVDADRVGDVIDKLLSNALKFNRVDGEISMTVGTDGPDAVIRVTDTGVGMSVADQEHIFERFFRSSVARDGVVPGAGLGLSTAKTIVDSHKGSISVASILDEGTTIEVRLPLVA